jgi:hypothetical protein
LKTRYSTPSKKVSMRDTSPPGNIAVLKLGRLSILLIASLVTGGIRAKRRRVMQ